MKRIRTKTNLTLLVPALGEHDIWEIYTFKNEHFFRKWSLAGSLYNERQEATKCIYSACELNEWTANNQAKQINEQGNEARKRPTKIIN